MATRRRTTELDRETRRRVTTQAIALGQEVRRERRRRRRTQASLGASIDVSQAEVSRIERGLGRRAPLETWVALGVALERPLAVSFSKPRADERAGLGDGHLDIQEHVLRLARATGRPGTFEVPTRPLD